MWVSRKAYSAFNEGVFETNKVHLGEVKIHETAMYPCVEDRTAVSSSLSGENFILAPNHSLSTTRSTLDASIDTCYLRCLDDTVATIKIGPKSTVREVVNALCETRGIGSSEMPFFGIATMHQIIYNRVWLQDEVALQKQLRSERKGVFEAYFLLRHYPLNPQVQFTSAYARKLTILQLMNDFTSRTLRGSENDLYLLAAYFIKYKYKQDKFTCVEPDVREWEAKLHFLTNKELLNENLKLILEKTLPMIEFGIFNISPQLESYGMELFNLSDKHGTALVMGVCASGIYIYKIQQIMNIFTWSMIRSHHLDEKKGQLVFQVCLPKKGIRKLGLRFLNHKDEVRLCYARFSDCEKFHKKIRSNSASRTRSREPSINMRKSSGCFTPLLARAPSSRNSPSLTPNMSKHCRTQSLLNIVRRGSKASLPILQDEVTHKRGLILRKKSCHIDQLDSLADFDPQQAWQFHIRRLHKLIESEPLNKRTLLVCWIMQQAFNASDRSAVLGRND
ncbi:hypothetical protein Ciccas_004895 [Cichlidogyrus casuarinus]|uniref:protein-tyrosine-phosphatase n=1 Tax=Cichlidogyrus casuarinus TaxID=1844966 RepID=A0ABD2QAL7_9PLAT